MMQLTLNLDARRPPVLTTADRLAFGGHAFVPPRASTAGCEVWRCVRCHTFVPRWAFAEGFVFVFAGRRCRELHRALGPG